MDSTEQHQFTIQLAACTLTNGYVSYPISAFFTHTYLIKEKRYIYSGSERAHLLTNVVLFFKITEFFLIWFYIILYLLSRH